MNREGRRRRGPRRDAPSDGRSPSVHSEIFAKNKGGALGCGRASCSEGPERSRHERSPALAYFQPTFRSRPTANARGPVLVRRWLETRSRRDPFFRCRPSRLDPAPRCSPSACAEKLAKNRHAPKSRLTIELLLRGTKAIAALLSSRPT